MVMSVLKPQYFSFILANIIYDTMIYNRKSCKE